MDSCKIIVSAFVVWLCPQLCSAKDYIVYPDNPYSIEAAIQQSRLDRIHEGITDVHLKLQKGIFRILQPVIIRPEDSGMTIEGENGTVISGGTEIKGWKKSGKLYVAQQPVFNGKPLEFRQLYVNGTKATRARDVDDFEKMFRIMSVDKQKECLYVPAKAVKRLVKEHKSSDFYYAELVLHEMWCIANLCIRDIEIMGDSAAVYFHQPESHIHFMHPWPSPMVTKDGHNSAFYIMAQTFLDTPGEWWLDSYNHKVYYYPKNGEQVENIEVPAVETLLKVEGTPDEPVKNISISNVTFEKSTWLRPSQKGHAPLQAGMYMIEAYKVKPKIERVDDHKLDNQGWVGRPAAAISLNCAENVNFTHCTVQHTGSTGIDYHLYIKDGNINNCTFTDIAGSAILAGSFGPESHEAHLPYNPTDKREICNGLTIENNYINNAANEDWGCIGIAAGFVKNIKIMHNEICNVSYTGISLGWGWNRQPCAMGNNLVHANLIHHYAKHMYDTAGIYTLGNQPNTFITENVVRDICTPGYAHDPNHWFYLYTDEGSSHITIKDNWTPSEKYLQNANGPDNIWVNNGPKVADSIVKNAGINKSETTKIIKP